VFQPAFVLLDQEARKGLSALVLDDVVHEVAADLFKFGFAFGGSTAEKRGIFVVPCDGGHLSLAVTLHAWRIEHELLGVNNGEGVKRRNENLAVFVGDLVAAAHFVSGLVAERRGEEVLVFIDGTSELVTVVSTANRNLFPLVLHVLALKSVHCNIPLILIFAVIDRLLQLDLNGTFLSEGRGREDRVAFVFSSALVGRTHFVLVRILDLVLQRVTRCADLTVDHYAWGREDTR